MAFIDAPSYDEALVNLWEFFAGPKEDYKLRFYPTPEKSKAFVAATFTTVVKCGFVVYVLPSRVDTPPTRPFDEGLSCQWCPRAQSGMPAMLSLDLDSQRRGCCLLWHAALAAIDPSVRKRSTMTTSSRSSSSVLAEFSESIALVRGRACMVRAACMGAARIGTVVVAPRRAVG
jgi:hypothetical protein